MQEWRERASGCRPACYGLCGTLGNERGIARACALTDRNDLFFNAPVG